MTEQTRKVALPAYLPKRLEAFRIAKGDKQSYLLRDKLLGKTHDLEPWQFFVLEVLPGCEDMDKLASVFQDRFGHAITHEQIKEVFAFAADSKLLAEDAATHPLLAPYLKKGYVVEGGTATVKSFRAAAGGGTVEAAHPPAAAPAPAPAAGGAPAAPTELPAGVEDAVGLDPKTLRRMWVLVDPRPLLRVVAPALSPLKHAVYLLPFLALAALMLMGHYSHLAVQDFAQLHANITLFEHLLFSLVTVNLTVTIATAVIAHRYRASVEAFGIAIFGGFLPRFVVRVTHAAQMTRRERMLVHAGPLLTRLALFSLGVFTWYSTRDGNGVAPQIGLGIAVICAIDLVVASGNPLVKGSGYHLLSAFINEPHLRGKSFRVLMNKLSGKVYKEADNNLLVTYALATFTFGFVLVLMIVLMVGTYLQQMQLGGTGIIIAALLGGYLVRANFRRFSLIGEAYERTLQFERWRNRTLPPPSESQEAEQAAPKSKAWSYARRAAGLALFICLFLPYPYEAGGRFVIFPSQREVLTTDVPGVVEAVFFDGGQFVKKGTPIARVAAIDLKSQIAVYEARVAEQKAVIADLKKRPKPEEVQLAQRELEVAQRQQKFSGGRVPRIEKLYADGTVSFEELDQVRKQAEVDTDQVQQKQAALDLVKVGVTRERIAAEEAKLQALVEERVALEKKVARTVLTMPFDGTILTLHLNQKLNSYLDKGAVFANVENAGVVTAEIEVPETDIGRVKLGGRIRAKPNSYSELVYEGKVVTIDNNVTVQSFGNVVKVVAAIDNRKGELRTGMTGYAKVDGGTLPVWKAFSLAVIRFINVQVWSWIP